MAEEIYFQYGDVTVGPNVAHFGSTHIQSQTLAALV
ncbi:hypothetical protein MESS2_740073 [Mesorhizobium metallidurans STM 2683]|uniref:Uncharacterized protein n=1 Tax=Mesorhizobium metallidurans STM 2683 TaxID=1297569 RepID=M5F968_9HYPH|nr:hypothetical protein MESS2_740073 [Mesorhizobium metallidurans STM 2683]